MLERTIWFGLIADQKLQNHGRSEQLRECLQCQPAASCDSICCKSLHVLAFGKYDLYASTYIHAY